MGQQPHRGTRLISTLRDDFGQKGFFDRLKREAHEIEEFYLSEEEREQLRGKGSFWRWFVLAWWVLKSSILRLSSFRRILLIVGLVLTVTDYSYRSGNDHLTIEYRPIGGLLILLVLILEQKDKLLAHDELEAGRAVQHAMMPEPAPFVPGWNVWLFTRSANEVGGDLVDILPLGGNRFGVSLGDVAGKGLGAALFMVKIQSTLRALAPDVESLSDLVSKLNSILLRDGMPGKFASLCYVRIDSSSGELRFINAGHMPPLVASQDGVMELPKGNAALGLSAKSQFEAHTMTVNSGESFIVYSDGLTEAQNERGEFYGVDRLKALCAKNRLLSAQAFGETILASVAAFEGNARKNDDLSLIILQRSA